MAHKITAIRLQQTRTGFRISGLTQSPRGTRVIAKSIVIETKGEDKDTRNRKIDEALKELEA